VAVRASGSSTARDAAAAQSSIFDYMARLVDEKERNPGDDLISQVGEEGGGGGDLALQASCMCWMRGSFFIAGLLACPTPLCASSPPPPPPPPPQVIKQDLKGGDITKEQLVAHAFLLLVAGNATVASCVWCTEWPGGWGGVGGGLVLLTEGLLDY